MASQWKIQGYWDQIGKWVNIDSGWTIAKARKRYNNAVDAFPYLRIRLVDEGQHNHLEDVLEEHVPAHITVVKKPSPMHSPKDHPTRC